MTPHKKYRACYIISRDQFHSLRIENIDIYSLKTPEEISGAIINYLSSYLNIESSDIRLFDNTYTTEDEAVRFLKDLRD